MTRQMHSIEQIKDMLLAEVEAVAYAYAPPAPGSYEDKGLYFTLNPGRADRSVGSFYVHLRGAKAGKWTDHATGAFGDILDLIALGIGREKDTRAALHEARLFLGLDTESPDDKRRRAERAAEAKRQRAIAARSAKEDAEKLRRLAHRVWLEGQVKLRGTPVAEYLRQSRGIDLAALPRQPNAIRYHPACYYKHTDKETGEFIEARLPAMVTIVTDVRGQPVAVHRTYLELVDGRWSKARVPAAKKVLGNYAGAAINLWSGIGPRGGKAVALSKAPHGTHAFIAEGVEDALSAVLLMPEERVLAGIALDNLASLDLPDTVTQITFIADQDEHEEARAALQRAIDVHWSKGRSVRVWRNQAGGKDLNDALLSHSKSETQEDAE